MPQYRPVRGNAYTDAFLQTVIERAAEDHAVGIYYVQPETVSQVVDFHAEFASTLQRISQLKDERKSAVLQVKKAMRMLKLRMRAAWDEVSARVEEGLDSPALYAYYEMTSKGDTPTITERGGWLELAMAVISGAERAHAAGYEPVNSYQAMIDALHAASAATAQLSNIKLTLKTTHNHLDALRPQARKLCDRVVRELRCFAGEETPSRQREIMREYGVKFKANASKKGKETQEEQESSSGTGAENSKNTEEAIEPATEARLNNAEEATEMPVHAPTAHSNGVADPSI